MELFQVHDDARLFISPVVSCWDTLAERGVDVVIDLEGDIDHGVPTAADSLVYVYYPIHDEELPNLARLRAVALMGAELVRQGHGVLSHCGMGFNRSALLAGMIMHELGMDGPEIVAKIRERRPGALFNDVFADHLAGLRRPNVG
jgi:protein-tyrosine phosphatase